MAAHIEPVSIHGAAVEIGDFLRPRGIGEVHDRHAALVPGLDHQIAAGHRDQIAVVGHAVLRPGLGGRQLEEALADEAAVLDRGDQVGAPGGRVLGPAARRGAAAPFVREQHLVPGRVEGGGVPVGHVRIEQLGHPRRVLRIRDVQQDAVAAARAGRQTDLGIDGDVVAVVGRAAFLPRDAVAAALPQARHRAGLAVGEDARPVDDGGLLRRVQRHLDHVDRIQRRLGIVGRLAVLADRQLLALAHPRGGRVVDIEHLRIGRMRDQGVGVRSPAGLHRRDLAGRGQVADVEDADAAEAFGVDLALGVPDSAVQPGAVLLDRHEQQVPVHRDVALTAGADHRQHQFGRAFAAHVVRVEAVEIADE